MYKVYHELFAKLEGIVRKEKVQIELRKDNAVSLVVKTFLIRVEQLKASITILLEAAQYEDAAILARVLLETTVRLVDICKDREKALTRAAAYLTNGDEFKSKVLSDMQKMKFEGIDFEGVKAEIDGEKQKIVQSIGIEDDIVPSYPNVEKLFASTGLEMAYSLFYRRFSQYIHSKPTIGDLYDKKRREELRQHIMSCCTLCWLVISDALNHMMNLGLQKEWKSWMKDYRHALKRIDK